MGMAIAEAIHREVEAGLPDEADPAKRIAALNTAAVAHARAARAVRLALALQQRLLTGGHASVIAANDPFDDRPMTVEWLPYDRGPESTKDPTEGVGGDRYARPDRERDDLQSQPHRSAAELIALICRDVGLDDETAGRFQAQWTAKTADDPAREAGSKIIDHQEHQEHQDERPGPLPGVPFHDLL